MSHIHLDGVALGAEDNHPLFPPLTETISHEVVGLFGRNGSGKSTLLSAVAGLRAPIAGSITIAGRVGLMRQERFADHASLADALGVKSEFERLDRIERGAPLEDDFEKADWDLASRLERALAAFDLTGFSLDQAAKVLSGGEQVRVKLAALLLAEPSILLLDEPTNDLDQAGRSMVASLLERWEGPALVASHDRALLEQMDRIIELSPSGVLSVGGGWSAFKEQRGAVRAQALSALEHAKHNAKQTRALHQARSEQQAQRSKQGKKAAMRRDTSKLEINARKSQAEKTTARTNALGQDQIAEATEALKAAAALVERVVPIQIELPSSGLQPGHTLIDASGISMTIAGRHLFGPLDLVVAGPERIALMGPNGCGKSCLVRLLVGANLPSTGTVRSNQDKISVLDQHLSLLENCGSVLGAMKRHNPALDDHEAHAALARFGFRGDWGNRSVETLSGGERVRLAFACLFSGPIPPQMLILDEPTNHLDIYAIELLEQALRDYDGAILCISHDIAFRDSLGLERNITLPL